MMEQYQENKLIRPLQKPVGPKNREYVPIEERGRMKERGRKLSKLKEKIEGCKKCDLWENRTKAVPGGGPAGADLMFIGEAPGGEEDKQGKPFVGKAGSFLDELLESIDLDREDVFIGNILKCRPPNNRDPKEGEIEKCTPYLDKQIELINPTIISTLGRFATSYILKKYRIGERSMTQSHGKVFKVNSLHGVIKIIPQYHPAAVSYNPDLEEVMFEDFKVLKEKLGGEDR